MPQTLELLTPGSRDVVLALLTPLRWLPDWSATIVSFFASQSLGAMLVLSAAFLLPSLLLIAGMWSTMVSIYTLPFRSGRKEFVTAMALTWWDAGRVAWLYWTGTARLLVALVGWLLGSIKFVLLTIRNALVGIVRSPLAMLDWTSRRYFQPGMPWVAFMLLLLWSAVEATVFTFTLQPTLVEVFGGLTGYGPNPNVMAPLLWLFLFMLIAGSFACIQVLGEAIRSRRVAEIIQMALVESAVMFFEVIFLYRELIDAITPWIAQQSGGEVRLGLWSTMLLASFGWVGVRGMSWFLFGRFGTPALLAILGRQTITQDSPLSNVPEPVSGDMWRAPIDALKGDVAWFQAEGKRMFELLTLPVLQVLAAALNFAVVVVQSRPAFPLPFHTLDELLVATPFGGATAAAAASAPVPASAPTRAGKVAASHDPMPRTAS